tara:strand:- start:5036 stop:6034 length:999 start_codon:yes stop_codon:yes gene_type:complete
MRTLLITDLHLNSKVIGLLGAQKQTVKDIVKKEKPNEVIMMGDIFMYRKPSPSELLAFSDILGYITKINSADVVVLRGNHDSETKADDGVTALSVFDCPRIKIITHTKTEQHSKRVYIPHYENEKLIIDALAVVPKDYTVFGHFGYAGCLNSAGDADFDLSLRHFNSTTYLGHIHGFCQRQGGLPKAHATVTCLGTPYTTNYGEAFKENFYAILDEGEVEFRQPTSGPRHLVYKAQDIEDNLDVINNPNYFTFLRVVRDSNHASIPYDKINVAHLDVKYSPVFNEDEISSYQPERDLFSINDVIIEDYVKNANSTIPTKTLMEGYRLLKDEN